MTLWGELSFVGHTTCFDPEAEGMCHSYEVMLWVFHLEINVSIDVVSKETNALHVWEQCHSVRQMTCLNRGKEIGCRTKIAFCE